MRTNGKKMRYTIKKSKCFILLVLVFLLVFNSCAKISPNGTSLNTDRDGSDVENSGSENIPDPEEDYITLFSNGMAMCDVVYSWEVPEGKIRYSSIQAFHKTLCNIVRQPMNADGALGIYKDTEYKSVDERIPILFADTKLMKNVIGIGEANPCDYGFCVVDNKVVIYGVSLLELQNACSSFVEFLKKNITKNDDNKITIKIPSNTQKNFKVDVAMRELPEMTMGTDIMLVDSGDDSRLWISKECTVDDFNAYLTTLKESGFSLYAEHEMATNLYATLTKDDIIVDVWWTKNGELRVTACQGFDLFPSNSQSFTKICESGMGMLANSKNSGAGEMGMFFLLEDGRFVVIDGGNGSHLHEELFESMQKVAPDPEHITIAAWMFTHTHGDHIGAFKGIVANWSNYKNKLVVESFVYNFPGYENARSETTCADDGIRKNIEDIFPNAKRYKVHPGNVLYFANMKVEIIQTPESYILKPSMQGSFISNTMFRISIGDEIIFIEADAGEPLNKLVADTFGSFLECTILQASHHGGTGGYVTTNKLFKPEVVLFFNYDKSVETYTINRFLIDVNKNPNYKEHLYLENDTVWLPLPYIPGSSYILK